MSRTLGFILVCFAIFIASVTGFNRLYFSSKKTETQESSDSVQYAFGDSLDTLTINGQKYTIKHQDVR